MSLQTYLFENRDRSTVNELMVKDAVVNIRGLKEVADDRSAARKFSGVLTHALCANSE